MNDMLLAHFFSHAFPICSADVDARKAEAEIDDLRHLKSTHRQPVHPQSMKKKSKGTKGTQRTTGGGTRVRARVTDERL